MQAAPLETFWLRAGNVTVSQGWAQLDVGSRTSAGTGWVCLAFRSAVLSLGSQGRDQGEGWVDEGWEAGGSPGGDAVSTRVPLRVWGSSSCAWACLAAYVCSWKQ